MLGFSEKLGFGQKFWKTSGNQKYLSLSQQQLYKYKYKKRTSARSPLVDVGSSSKWEVWWGWFAKTESWFSAGGKIQPEPASPQENNPVTQYWTPDSDEDPAATDNRQ